MPARYLDQRRLAQQPPALAHGRIGHHRHPVLRAEGQQVEFHPAMLQAVEHLVRRTVRQRGAEFLEVVHIAVGHAPVADLARAPQRLEGFHGLRQGHRPAPVQQIEVDGLDPHPLQAALAGGDGTAARCVVRIDLGDDEHAVPSPGDGIADHLLGAAFGVHLGGVDQRHAEVEAEPQRLRLGRPVAGALAHLPGALAEGGNGRAVGKAGHGDVSGPVRGKASPAPRRCRSAVQSAATSTITSSASSFAVMLNSRSSRMAMPSRAAAAWPLTVTAPRAGTI